MRKRGVKIVLCKRCCFKRGDLFSNPGMGLRQPGSGVFREDNRVSNSDAGMNPLKLVRAVDPINLHNDSSSHIYFILYS